jgi:hypothetical protein
MIGFVFGTGKDIGDLFFIRDPLPQTLSNDFVFVLQDVGCIAT